MKLPEGESMVRVVFKPWEELIIHEAEMRSLDELVKLQIMGAQPGSLVPGLNWVDGIVFTFMAMTGSEAIKEQLQGKVHWTYLTFALMQTYQKEILVKEGNIRIPIIDRSNVEIFKEVVKWIRQQFET